MRILHVEGGRNVYGGAKQALYLLRGLDARGVQSALVCPRDSAVAAAAGEAGHRVFPVPMHGDADLLMSRRIARCIREFRPDLVHLHSRIGADVHGALAARRCGVPVVHTRRVDNPEPRWLVRVKYRLHDRVIAISRAIGDLLLEEGLPAQKLRIVRSAVVADDFDRPCSRERILGGLGLQSDVLLVGVVAQLIERKGHRFILDALPDLVAAHPRMQLVLFGKGHLAGRLQERIDAEGLADHARLAGFRDDMFDILPCMDLLVHPATMEGLGVSLLQASAAGVPIVASRAGGIPEAVQDGVNGLLVPPADVPALIAAVDRMLARPDLRRRLGEGGRALVRDAFSADVMVDGNFAVYRELLAE